MRRQCVNANSTFGELTTIKPVGHDKSRNIVWLCKCNCGKSCTVSSNSLIRGKVKSCGCLKYKHGYTGTRLHEIWHSMKQRCNNPNHINYRHYGGRGIKICEEWDTNFIAFKDWAISNGYTEELEIDRINNNEGYSPNNCRWVSHKVNCNNRNR